MKHLIYLSFLLFAFISCSNEKEKQVTHLLSYTEIESANDTLKINFSNGELKGEQMPVFSEDCICRYYNDTLDIECSKGFMVGGTIDLKIVKDSFSLNAHKYSCTYTDYYEAEKTKITINSKNYEVNDSIAIKIDALMIYTDTVKDYIDTLKINGVLKLGVRDKEYSFEKKWQEKGIQEFYDLTKNRPDTITSLRLDNLDLSFIPDEIKLFTNLKKLDLGNNNLSMEEFRKISELQSIEELSIRHNNLNQLPAEILNFQNLQRLDIFANNISSFPKGFSDLRLIELQMESNDFKNFPSELMDMSSLRELYMSGNEIDDYENEIKKMNQIEDYN